MVSLRGEGLFQLMVSGRVSLRRCWTTRDQPLDVFLIRKKKRRNQFILQKDDTNYMQNR